MLYLLELSLQSESGFALVLELLDNVIVKFAAWAVLSGLLYHLIAGIKHLKNEATFHSPMVGLLAGLALAPPSMA